MPNIRKKDGTVKKIRKKTPWLKLKPFIERKRDKLRKEAIERKLTKAKPRKIKT